MVSSRYSWGKAPIPIIIASAIGKSKWAPFLTTPTGDKLTDILFDGRARPIFDRAALTLSLNSETDFNKILPKYNGLKSELNSIDKEIEKREKEYNSEQHFFQNQTKYGKSVNLMS